MNQGTRRTTEQEWVDPGYPNSSMNAPSKNMTGERWLAMLSVTVVLLVLIAHIFWLSRHRGPMFWDDSMYAAGALQLYDGLDEGGLPGLAQRFIGSPAGAKAPLICLLPVPFFLVFGRGS